jgi:hypothetical protein
MARSVRNFLIEKKNADSHGVSKQNANFGLTRIASPQIGFEFLEKLQFKTI